MNFIPRTANSSLQTLAKSYPAVIVTGPRQSGKTTLTQTVFPEKPYVSLEDLDIREFASQDPRGFLNQYPDGAILDEVQRCPTIFSYLQTRLDRAKKMGMFVLTGSQQFGLLSDVSQSLAGRVAKIALLPFSFQELQNAQREPKKIEQLLFTGLYPPIYDRNLEPSIWYHNYVDTYLERDVRQLIQVRNLSTFQRFLRMCAARTGQLLNLSSLANDCGITHNTAKAWISVLEASFIIHLLQPHHQNFNKRLIKSPKLYFYDSGLAAWLQNLQSPAHLSTHPARGPLFETWVVSELVKYRFNHAMASNLYFWRDSSGNEVDVLVDQGHTLMPIEIKSGQTVVADFFEGLTKFSILAGKKASTPSLIYGGEHVQTREKIAVYPWKNIQALSPILAPSSAE
ncbi:MAG: ATP-binding protein [Nitrospirota bacterium]|nr:ATP-binding protein [Nitrospirota bacterium]